MSVLGENMKVFWHSDWEIGDLATRAQLSVAFEDVVVPGDVEGYFPHRDLKLPVSVPEKRGFYPDAKYKFWPSEARTAKPFYPYSAFSDYESAYEKFGKDFAEAQYERVNIKNALFDYYLQTAVENNGILLGNTELGESDFKLWLTSYSAADRSSPSLDLAHALLSLAGVRIAMPNLAPQHFDEVREVKRLYQEEILDYQAYIAELLTGVWDMVKTDPKPAELTRWASFVATTKIQPALRRVEAAVRTGDRQLLERIGYGLLTDVPNLVAGQLRGSNVSFVTASLEALLRILAPNLAQSIRERRALEASFGLSYLYRVCRVIG
jgi:hypothetical protein